MLSLMYTAVRRYMVLVLCDYSVQEVAGLMGDANYWKHETELQAFRKLFWDTVSFVLLH